MTQPATDVLTVTLTPFDRERLDALAAHFAAASPDLPVPTAEQVIRIALNELHRDRCPPLPAIA